MQHRHSPVLAMLAAAYCSRLRDVAWSLRVCVLGTRVSLAKTDKRIEMQFKEGRGGEGRLNRMGPKNRDLLDELHIGVTWRIRLNDPCAAAVRFCVILL